VLTAYNLGMNKTHLHIRVTIKFMDKLREIAKKLGYTVTDFVVDAVNEKIANERR
jgi:uncharacterized protein (DUF1778 family)